MHVPYTNHFIGFGLMSVVLDKDGGPGPRLKQAPYLRPESKSRINTLLQAFGTNLSSLANKDPDNAIRIGISRKYIDPSSLVLDLTKPFQHVKWTPEAQQAIAIRLAGLHRCLALQSFFSQTLSELEAAQDFESNAEVDHARNKKEINRLRDLLLNEGSWLVAFYDIGKCRADLGRKHNSFRSHFIDRFY